MHKILRCKAKANLKSPINIKFFRDFVKRFLAPDKRSICSIRSAVAAFLLLGAPLFAAFEDMTTSARLASLAGAGVAMSLGAESSFINPAAIYRAGTSCDSYLFYAKPYNLSDLNLGAAAVRFTSTRFAISGAVQNFGNSLYMENQFILTGALCLSEEITLGANMRYGALSIKGYGRTGSVLVDVGAVIRLHQKVRWATALKNANYAAIGKAKESLPQVILSGMSVDILSNLILNVDIYKDTRFPVDMRVGIEYSPVRIISFRIGAGLNPSRTCAGFSINLRQFRIDYGYKSHIDLGATHLFSFGFFK